MLVFLFCLFLGPMALLGVLGAFFVGRPALALQGIPERTPTPASKIAIGTVTLGLRAAVVVLRWARHLAEQDQQAAREADRIWAKVGLVAGLDVPTFNHLRTRIQNTLYPIEEAEDMEVLGCVAEVAECLGQLVHNLPPIRTDGDYEYWATEAEDSAKTAQEAAFLLSECWNMVHSYDLVTNPDVVQQVKWVIDFGYILSDRSFIAAERLKQQMHGNLQQINKILDALAWVNRGIQKS